MNAKELAAHALARLRLVKEPSALPPENARDHIANAVQVLLGHEAAHPAVWEFSHELRTVEALLFRALFLLDKRDA